MAGNIPGRGIGATTVGSSGAAGTGAGLGAAIGAIIVYTLGAAGIDVTPIEWAIVAVCAAGLSYVAGIFGGKYAPTDKALPQPSVEVSGGPVTVETSMGAPEVSEAGSGAHSASQTPTGRHRADGPAI